MRSFFQIMAQTTWTSLQPREADLTQLTRVLVDVPRDVAAQAPPRAPEYPEDPAFTWNLLRLPHETSFPVPSTGAVQRIAADLLTRLPTVAARDQHDTRFALAMAVDWPDLDDDGRDLVFQRFNISAIAASYGWPIVLWSEWPRSDRPLDTRYVCSNRELGI